MDSRDAFTIISLGQYGYGKDLSIRKDHDTRIVLDTGKLPGFVQDLHPWR